MPRQPPFHVWVDLTGMWRGAVPGVLIAWRHTDPGGWEAWIIRAESYSTGLGSEVQIKQGWVAVDLIKLANASHAAPP